MKFLAIFSILIFSVLQAGAVLPPADTCATYTAKAHTIRYNGGYEFCDGKGSSWQLMDLGFNPADTCTSTGRQKYSGNTMYFCDGTNWHTMDAGATTTTCAFPGSQLLTYKGNAIYCDGTNWHGMSTIPTLTCIEFQSQRHCTNASGCFWNNGCYDPADCAERMSASSCSINPSCAWSAGVCGSGI
jgi:hypothetical protein